MTNQISRDDLIPDSRMGEILRVGGSSGVDALNHRAIAKQIAAIVGTAEGYENIAVFGAWGTGKSSLFDFVSEELGKGAKRSRPKVLQFDAWSNAGSEFRVNFLSRLAAELGEPPTSVAELLYETTQSRRIQVRKSAERAYEKVGRGKGIALWTVVAVSALVALTWAMPQDLVDDLWRAFAVLAAVLAPVVSVGAVLGILDFASSTVSTSTPSTEYQFDLALKRLLRKAKGRRIVVLVDELDRCAPGDVKSVLEGLRTFLNHKQLTFVVAVDRKAVEHAIVARDSEHSARSSNAESGRPGEYLDKIFQYQISLPHRSPATWVPYARHLTTTSRGLWAAFADPDRDTILNLLVPRHTSTARRVKTLLNDFAISIRTLESIGIKGLERAPEVATMTVLRKDFPELAADLERNPSLLKAILGSGEHVSEATRTLADSYNASYCRAARITSSNPGDEPRATRLDEEFGSYVRFLRNFSSEYLPRADIIRMAGAGEIIGFDDATLVDAIDGIYDQDRSRVVGALRLASLRDQSLAFDAVLGRMRGDAPNLVATATAVLCALVRDNPALLPLVGRGLGDVAGMWTSATEPDPSLGSHLSLAELSDVVEVLGRTAPGFGYKAAVKSALLSSPSDGTGVDAFVADALTNAWTGTSELPDWAAEYAAKRLPEDSRPIQYLVDACARLASDWRATTEVILTSVRSEYDGLIGRRDRVPGELRVGPGILRIEPVEVSQLLRESLLGSIQTGVETQGARRSYAFARLAIGLDAKPAAADEATAAAAVAERLAAVREVDPQSACTGLLAAIDLCPQQIESLSDGLVGLPVEIVDEEVDALHAVLAHADADGVGPTDRWWEAAAIVAARGISRARAGDQLAILRRLPRTVVTLGRLQVSAHAIERGLATGATGEAVQLLADELTSWFGNVEVLSTEEWLKALAGAIPPQIVLEAAESSSLAGRPSTTWRELASSLALRILTGLAGAPTDADTVSVARLPEPTAVALVSLALRAGAPFPTLRLIRPTGGITAGIVVEDLQTFGKRAAREDRDALWLDAGAAGETADRRRALAGASLSEELVRQNMPDVAGLDRAGDRAEALRNTLAFPSTDETAMTALVANVGRISQRGVADDLKGVANVLLALDWAFDASQVIAIRKAVTSLNERGKGSPISQSDQRLLFARKLLERVRQPPKRSLFGR